MRRTTLPWSFFAFQVFSSWGNSHGRYVSSIWVLLFGCFECCWVIHIADLWPCAMILTFMHPKQNAMGIKKWHFWRSVIWKCIMPMSLNGIIHGMASSGWNHSRWSIACTLHLFLYRKTHNRVQKRKNFMISISWVMVIDWKKSDPKRYAYQWEKWGMLSVKLRSRLFAWKSKRKSWATMYDDRQDKEWIC